MSETINEINKITVNSSLRVNNINMTTLLFADKLACSKTGYTITDNLLVLRDQPQTDLNLFQFIDKSEYYEFVVNLRSQGVVISGKDRFGNTLSNLSNTILIFVNGYKLAPNEYSLDIDNNSITIYSSYPERDMSCVIVYASEEFAYEGNVEDDFSWNPEFNQFLLKDYTAERYVFFKNGELLPPSKIQKVGEYVRLNTIIRHGVDFVEYYRMSRDCCALTFTPMIGYLTYGPKDDKGTVIQNPYNCVLTFDDVVKLVIDDIRPGFFVHENNTGGCIMIVDEDFEKRSVKCLVIEKFKSTLLTSDEYFLTVPDAPSIMKYVSQYDLNGTLFKELLITFQKVLLNETYDSIQRLKNVRNIDNVDSTNISAMINFLGLEINVTNLTLQKKHQLIEELRTFYNVVGTRASYNFYNAIRNEGKILNIEQLFTPIKNYQDEGGHDIQRYVTFRTAEELGAKYKQKYVTDTIDFGQVSELAEGGINLSNSPSFEGVLRYADYPVLLQGFIDRYDSSPSGPVEVRDNIVLPLSIVTDVQIERTMDFDNYDYQLNEYNQTAILNRYTSLETNVTVPEEVISEETIIAFIKVSPNNLQVQLRDSEGKKLRIYRYIEAENTFCFVLDDTSEYTYEIVDSKKNIIYLNTLSRTHEEISTVLPMINDYVTNPQIGPNKATIDCGYITDDPVDFYDFGSVSEQLKGHWVSWYEWDREKLGVKNWYPTNHIDISLQLPLDIDYNTFTHMFKDIFYEMASTVLYIHQITQMYIFGNPDNNGSEEIQPMSLITTQTYQTEEQCLTSDPSFLPYRKALDSKPLTLQYYMFRNPTYEYVNNNQLKVTVDLYENFGRDEYLYNTTGEEKDIEITQTITGLFPCKIIDYTDWTIEQDTDNFDPTTAASWDQLKSLPVITVTCIPTEDRRDWFYGLVINYDNRDESYTISKDLQTVVNRVTTNTIKKLQVNIDGEIYYLRPNSVFYEKGTWYLSYASVDEKFSTFRWKLAKLNDTNPENQIEPLDIGIAEFNFEDASDMQWNINRPTQVVVDSKSEVIDDKLYISVDILEDLYGKVNRPFDINLQGYSEHYSYAYNNTMWSCDLKKYDVRNEVGLTDITEKNCATLLLPVNMSYYDNNKKIGYNFTDIDYLFDTLTPEKLNYKNETIIVDGKRIKKAYWRYTNHFASSLDQSTISFDTYGTLLASDKIIIKDVDYLIFGYTHIPDHGSHLDTFTRIVNSKNSNYNIAVGHYAGDYAQVPFVNQTIGSESSEMAYNPNCLMQWCRHNQGNYEHSPYYYTTENVIINVNSFKDDLYKNDFDDVVIFDLYCAYLGSVSGVTSSEDVKITIRGYKNGNIVKYTFDQKEEHDVFQFDNVDDFGQVNEPNYYVERPLENMYIAGRLTTTIPYYAIPEEYTDATVRQRLRKVARISYTQSTQNLLIEIIPAQNS